MSFDDSDGPPELVSSSEEEDDPLGSDDEDSDEDEDERVHFVRALRMYRFVVRASLAWRNVARG